ncbi:hypothetical protein T05_14037 [Trichinella murrelli]|uniref:Uncharacterized protein n=1 Tax=Trichinella murrelli TaxID=144512 RepID=A0A0V0TU02_9BILA|nr:hypothetical protein T05_14037 [Trichinella murrelli]
MKNTSQGRRRAKCRRREKKLGLCRPVPGECIRKCFGPDRFILVIIKAGFLFIFQTLAIRCLSLDTNKLFGCFSSALLLFPSHSFIYLFIVVNFFHLQLIHQLQQHIHTYIHTYIHIRIIGLLFRHTHRYIDIFTVQT